MICDFAEYYHVLDYKSLRPSVCATLAAGLRDGSRIMMKATESKMNTTELLLAKIADNLSILVWQNTEDGQKGNNFPKSIINEIYRDHSEDIKSFDCGADFEAERQRLINGY